MSAVVLDLSVADLQQLHDIWMPQLLYYPHLTRHISLVPCIQDHIFVQYFNSHLLLRREVNCLPHCCKSTLSDRFAQLERTNNLATSELFLLTTHTKYINHYRDFIRSQFHQTHFV